MKVYRRVSILGLALLATLTITACEKDKKVITPPPSEYLAATSIANVFANFMRAYEERSIEEYAKCFDGPMFHFEFSERDRQSDPQIPFAWDFADDQASTKNMFDDETVDKIVLRFTQIAPVAATEADQLPGGPEGAWKVTLQNVHLEVHVVDNQGGPLEYLVENDGADFFLRQYPNEPVDGVPSWKIFLWRDRPAGALRFGTESKTWGSIKNLYGK